MNIQWALFLNFEAWNKHGRDEMPLKSVNYSVSKIEADENDFVERIVTWEYSLM